MRQMNMQTYNEKNYLCGMDTNTGIASKYLVYAITGIITFLAPLHATFCFVGLLVMADFFTGIGRAIKYNRVKSERMADKFWVSFGYFLGILVAHTVEGYFGDAVPIVKAVVAIIALTELQSLRENITQLTGTDILKPLEKLLKKESEPGD